MKHFDSIEDCVGFLGKAILVNGRSEKLVSIREGGVLEVGDGHYRKFSECGYAVAEPVEELYVKEDRVSDTPVAIDVKAELEKLGGVRDGDVVKFLQPSDEVYVRVKELDPDGIFSQVSFPPAEVKSDENSGSESETSENATSAPSSFENL